jgi:hypothetical protein
MRQTVKFAYPPNFDAILQRFPEASRKGVIFSYGDAIYNPWKVQIPKHLIAHEGTHGQRQEAAGIDQWWERYLDEPLFRLDEEIYAHHAEYKVALRNIGPGALKTIAQRLAGNLYGNVINYESAVRAILTGEVA